MDLDDNTIKSVLDLLKKEQSNIKPTSQEQKPYKEVFCTENDLNFFYPNCIYKTVNTRQRTKNGNEKVIVRVLSKDDGTEVSVHKAIRFKHADGKVNVGIFKEQADNKEDPWYLSKDRD